jgi:chromatin remodeling complex protein RSC6
MNKYVNNNINNMGVNNTNAPLVNNINQMGQNDNNKINNNMNIDGNNINNLNIKKEKETDVDGFCIKRPAKEENMKITILFYLSYHIQEFILAKELSELLGITKGTRPQILYHLWQYIKLNSLQDNENPKIVINNKQLSKIFKCEKMEISSLTSRLSEYLKIPPPIEIEFLIHDLREDYSKNQILRDIELTIDDPYCNNLLGFLSNANEESLLFPKRFFISNNLGNGDIFGKYLEKINDIEKQYSSYMNIMKRHKYYYDFFDAYEKDPILFIDNFMIQQNELIKKINDQATSIVRADYNSSQYYKDYEEVLRDNVEKYLNKKRQPPK